MSQSTQHPEWVNLSDKGQVQRSTIMNTIRQGLFEKMRELPITKLFQMYEDQSTPPIERLILGVALLAITNDSNAESLGVKGIGEILAFELASNLQEWVTTGNDDHITIPLQMCEVALNKLVENL